MIKCKHCGCEEVVKNGKVGGKQRYLCSNCKKNFRIGDEREKYSMEQKLRVIKLYTEGVGIRAIERLEGVSSPLIIQWIRNFGRILKQELSSIKVPENAKEIEVLEVDELFTYYKKKPIKPMFGLLLIGTEIKLLIL